MGYHFLEHKSLFSLGDPLTILVHVERLRIVYKYAMEHKSCPRNWQGYDRTDFYKFRINISIALAFSMHIL